MIFLDVGVALLMSVGKWYEQIITVIVASVLSFIVILFGEKQHGSQRKWMVFLFALFGVFAVIAFILVVLWVILKEKYLLVANMVCWCFEMIISKLELLIVEGEFSKVNCSRVSIADSSVMMKFAFGDASTVTGQKNCNCIFERNKDPLVFSGFLLTLIGLVLGLIIMFNNKLHSASAKNSVFIVITVS
ncbi:unnamed protein product [Schistosoma mattheei]|uniref:Uncharacterized protein n=1 Tax=Schistosoma mattheei TaxID=31246 RepID=A0AA85ARV2_9TREM|nr:unnamed protein product [Schistosoma mattheei]